MHINNLQYLIVNITTLINNITLPLIHSYILYKHVPCTKNVAIIFVCASQFPIKRIIACNLT